MKKLLVIISTGILLAFASFMLATDEFKATATSITTGQEGTITGAVNLRTAPTTSSNVLGTVPRGTKVEVLEQHNQHWVKIRVQGHTGYVSTSFISVSNQAPSIHEGTVTGAVNLRTAPSTSSNVIGTVPRGTKVQIVEQHNQHWVKIRVQGHVGYISTSFITILNNGSNSPTNPPSVQPEKPVNNTPNPPVSANRKADQIIETGLRFIGTPYQFGARAGQTSTFDCSSFMQYIFGVNDVRLPRNSRQQAAMPGTNIFDLDKLQKGDLIFFRTGIRSDGQIDHVGVYMGDGKFLHTIPNGGVQVHNLSGNWLRNAAGAKRVL